jgi:hypothetical protein
MPAVRPVKNDGCPLQHTVQEEHRVRRLGDLVPEAGGQGQDAARGPAVFPQMKNHLHAVDPVFATHFFNRNYPSPFYHFSASAILLYTQVSARTWARYCTFI